LGFARADNALRAEFLQSARAAAFEQVENRFDGRGRVCLLGFGGLAYGHQARVDLELVCACAEVSVDVRERPGEGRIEIQQRGTKVEAQATSAEAGS
jgi:hypothetical protein